MHKLLSAGVWDPSPQIVGVRNGEPVTWHLAEEVPALLLFNGERFGVMMITPADIEEFALGFTLNEGIFRDRSEVEAVRVENGGEGVIINLKVSPEAALRAAERRRSVAGQSSCGLCGAQTLEVALPLLPRVSGPLIAEAALVRALEALPEHQAMNLVNHSTHSAALCHASGDIRLIREDIGRHNALDKLCGAMARAGLSASEGFLLLSSRFSVELALKAATMGFATVLSVSAPSALALRLAGRAGMCVATRAERSGVILFRPTA
jgi:FdhD protein